MDRNGIELAAVVAYSTSCATLLNDIVRVFCRSDNCISRAFFKTYSAAYAFIRVNRENPQTPANSSRAFSVVNMAFEFGIEILHHT